MKLELVSIKNYRSIEEISFDINQLDDKSFTYGLIGVNEVGKSTILKALALKEGLKNEKGEVLPLLKDFKDKAKQVEIEYSYTLEKKEMGEIREYLSTNASQIEITGLDFSRLKFVVFFDPSTPNQAQTKVEIINVPSDKAQIQDILKDFISKKVHKSIFWTAEDRYLISQPINLSQFSAAPNDFSIPLRNCFYLAGVNTVEAIQAKIQLISESTEREQLENELGEKVTEHIKAAWPKHPISITFSISDGLINFHVKDLNSKARAKTADQRSDGFKQFISFLLTISAQDKNQELSNTILLLDEPETHLHPQAQEDLLRELIKITRNERNNIAFFATHSNYMIDKNDLSRNYRIIKDLKKDTGLEKTEKEQFDKKTSTYASVSYEVFEIYSGDYHNQLYDLLREEYAKSIKKDPDVVGIKEFDNGFLQQEKKLKTDYPYKGKNRSTTLPTYIRNAVHYPSNKDKNFEVNLRKSIELLASYNEK